MSWSQPLITRPDAIAVTRISGVIPNEAVLQAEGGISREAPKSWAQSVVARPPDIAVTRLSGVIPNEAVLQAE
jgi:hypothetical protein